MDLDLFERVIRNILHVNVLRPDRSPDACAAFSKKYCYDPVLQPALQADALRQLVDTMEENILYDARGQIGICILFFRFAGEPFVIGPFVRREYDEANIRSVLMSHKIPASVAASIKLYYSAFPLISISQLRNVVMSAIQAFTNSTEEYAVRRLENITTASPDLTRDHRADSLDYSTVYRHYELENAFLHQIETGNTENVIAAYQNMSMGSTRNRYVSAIQQNPVIGLSMVRVLARKAAERGGVSPVEVDDITQRAAQKVLASSNMDQQVHYTMDMLLELTEAVKRKRLSLDRYSSPVRHAVEYLRFNFSQEVSPARLARLVNLSDAYFTKCFKKEVGMTITQYIARLRCDEAARLLRESDTPIQEISEYVGYPDNNYFVKVFKAHYGLTPSDYRAGREPHSATQIPGSGI